MTDGTMTPQAREYLRELDRALAGVEATTAAELRDGVAESLLGLDDAATQEQIAELGDPAFVAASARGALAEAPLVPSTALPRTGTSSLAYVLATTAVSAFAGFLLPVIGWIGGVAMVWASPVWRRGEKWAATLVPLALCAVVVGWGISAAVGAATGMPRQYATYTDAPNPLVPSGYDLLWSAIVAAWIVLPATATAVAIWLLVRGLARTGRLHPASTGFATAAALVFGLGGFVLPVLGWVAGVAMVCASGAWRRWQKVVAITVPVAAAIAAIVASAAVAAQAPGIVDDPTGSFQVPNPMLDQPVLLQWNVPLALWPILPAAATLVTAWLLLEIRRSLSPRRNGVEQDG